MQGKNFINNKSVIIFFLFAFAGLFFYSQNTRINWPENKIKGKFITKFAGQVSAQSSSDFLINIGTKQSITVLNHDDGNPTPTPVGVTPSLTLTPPALQPTSTPVSNLTPTITPPSCISYYSGECRSSCFSDQSVLNNLSARCERYEDVCCVCPILTPPVCDFHNSSLMAVNPGPLHGCVSYVCITVTPTPTGKESSPTPIDEVIFNIGNKQSLIIIITESGLTLTPTDILPSPSEIPSPTQVLATDTPIPSITLTPTEIPLTVTTTPEITITETPTPQLPTFTPTATPTVTPIAVSPTPDYSNEYTVDIGNKRTLTIRIGEAALTPSPTGLPVSCTTDNECSHTQICNSTTHICTEISCPNAPVCTNYVKVYHQCILVNLPDGISCNDSNNVSGFCYSGACSNITSTPTLIPSLSPSVTPTTVITPTPIPVDPSTPRIRFSVKLFGIATTPDVSVRLKVTDLVAQLTPAPGVPGDSCQTPGEGETFYSNIIITADTGGIYRPKPGTLFATFAGLAAVETGGWLPLAGIAPNRAYSLSVKGPLHRNRSMEANVVLVSAAAVSQDFDWTGKPLEPGDLPNPNRNLTQDCIINSIDLSLIESRIGANDVANLSIADVNYDSIVNGNDIAKTVYTISFKPDDDTIPLSVGQAPVLNLVITPTPTVNPFLTPTGTSSQLSSVDLMVTDITRDATSYNITICNQGPGSVVPNLYMLITNVTTGQNYEWQTGYFEYKNASYLCFSEPISCGRIGDSNCSGNIAVRAETDWRKYIVESNETNNTFEKAF